MSDYEFEKCSECGRDEINNDFMKTHEKRRVMRLSDIVKRQRKISSEESLNYVNGVLKKEGPEDTTAYVVFRGRMYDYHSIRELFDEKKENAMREKYETYIFDHDSARERDTFCQSYFNGYLEFDEEFSLSQ